MNFNYLGASFSILLWMYLLFIAAVPSGWVHLLLAVGVVLVARGIVNEKKK
jgi:hypothetical protein